VKLIELPPQFRVDHIFWGPFVSEFFVAAANLADPPEY
jgi:hypothetical protein